MDPKKYDRLRRLEELERLLARFSRRPIRTTNVRVLQRLGAFRVGRIRTRLFLILWELPLELQLGLCGALALWTLPAFEQRHPTLTSMRDFLSPDWMREAIGQSGASRRAHWERLGYESNDLWQALDEQSPIGGDEDLHSASCGIWDALEPDAAPGKITSGCIYSVFCTVTAWEYEAWERIDPEAAEFVRDVKTRLKRGENVVLAKDEIRYRIPELNPAALEVWFAGWEAVIAWLRAAHIEQYDEVKDRCALANAVRQARNRWKEAW